MGDWYRSEFFTFGHLRSIAHKLSTTQGYHSAQLPEAGIDTSLISKVLSCGRKYPTRFKTSSALKEDMLFLSILFPCQYWISASINVFSAILCLHWMWVCVEAAAALCFQDQYKTFGVKSLLSCSENAKYVMWYFRLSVPRCTQSTDVRSYASSRSVNPSDPRANVPNL